MITPTEAKQLETQILSAVELLNDLIRNSYTKGVQTRLYVDGSAVNNAAGIITFCDITVRPSYLLKDE